MCRRGVSSPLNTFIRRLLKMKPQSVVDFVYRHFGHMLRLTPKMMPIYKRTMSQIVLLTLDEAAARLRCTVAKVQRLCLDGDLTFLAGRPLLVPEEAINAYIAGKLKHGAKSASSEIPDNRTAEDIALAEVELTLQAMAKRNGGKLSSTPQIRKMLEPFMHRPEMKEAQRRGMVARYERDKREAASAQKKAAAQARAEKAGRDPNEEPKRRRTKARKPRSKHPQSKRSVAPTVE